MFRPFHPRFAAPAWAEEAFGNSFFMSGRHGGRGSRGKGAFGGDWGDESRTRRGDIKFILLELLSERPQHGYELMKSLEARRGGFRRSSPGSVYPTLQMLEDGGYLSSQEVEGKRVYTITDSGRLFLRDRPSGSSNPDDRIAHKPTELIELRQTLTELNDAVVQLAHSGNLEQAKQVRDRLVQVKREIYKLLSEA